MRRNSTDSPRRLTTLLCTLLLVLTAGSPLLAEPIDRFADRPDNWFNSPDGRRVLDNILTWQNANGGWWKAYDATSPRPRDHHPTTDPRFPVQEQNTSGSVSTFDNKATYTEMRILARAFRVTQEPRYRQAFERGLKFSLAAQYSNGGWPQRFPLGKDYGRRITFNDNAMVGVMLLLRDVAAGGADFAWTSPEDRQRCREAFDRGVQCILDCQIKTNGVLTAWCQQHDEKSLAPAAARSYELPSISGGESPEIVLLLMSLDRPDERVKESVRRAVAWMEASKITGKRLEKRAEPESGKSDLVVVDDPAAEPLWARFYDLETNRPFFSGRDGVKKASLAEIERERRTGYAWLRPWGAKVLAAYPNWAAKHGVTPVAFDPPPASTAPATAPSRQAASASDENVITVAADGSGDHATVQAAVDAAPKKSEQRVVIRIKPGTYKERVRVGKDKVRLTFRGEDANTTVLTFDLYASKVLPPATQGVGTSGSYSTLIEGDDFTAENITFENSAGEVGQAVALRTTGQRQAFFNCRMLGWQDTLYLHEGRAYFKDCYIEGRVDFIFGRAVAVFENCHVHSKNGGYVTAAATEAGEPYGYLFLNCKLTGTGQKAYLGRPWRDHAAVAFVRCELGDHVRPEGWDNWKKPEREKTARYVEHKCSGPGADRSQRVAWSRELSDEEAAKYTVANVLSGTDGWKPSRTAKSSTNP